MELILKGVNAVLGVIGSFICLPDGKIAAQAVPEKYTAADLNLVARVTSQTLQALNFSGQRVTEAMLLFAEGRLVLKNFRGGTLVILCARNINIPLLNLTANVAVKNLITETRALKPTPPAPAVTSLVAPAPPPTTPVTLSPVEKPALVSELDKHAQQIIDAASSARIPLWIMDPVALWRCCRNTRRLLTVPKQRQIEFAGQSEYLAQISQLFERSGYQRKTRPNAPPTTRRLLFSDPTKSVNLVLMLDTFEMYHRFEFKPLVRSNDPILPPTALTLIRLQLVELPEEALSDLAALFIEYDVSLTPKPNQIDASQITALGAEDWGWYKTISMNLEQLTYFAEDNLLPNERNVVIERARRVKSSLDVTPKSLRWQARARLGESVRWYETPVEADAPTRPDMAFG